MKKVAFILVLMVVCFACTNKGTSTQEETIQSQDSVVVAEEYSEVEVKPEFPGGMNELMVYLRDNIKYPSKAVENQWEGKALCQFVIEKDGSVCDAEIVRSSGYQLLDVEAMRLVLNMPTWKPGVHNGDSVRVKFTLPILFKLE